MEKVNLFWAIIWSIMAVFCLIAIFWNPAQFLMLAISGAFAVMYWHEYHETKDV
jgi:hypothetical protein